MSLQRVEKASMSVISSLDEMMSGRIKKWYLNGSQDQEVQHWLQRAWEEKAWFHCDCHPEGQGPFMHVRRTPLGHYALVRMQQYGKHAESCPFNQKPFSEAGESFSKTDSAPSMPRLKRLLLELITKAGLNNVSFNRYGKPVDIEIQYDQLHEASARIMVDEHTPLSEVFWTHPAALERVLRTLLNKASESQRSMVPGYMFLMVDCINDKTLMLLSRNHKYEIEVVRDLHVEHKRHPGPWIGMIEINRSELSEGEYKPLTGYFLPAASKNILCPINPEEYRALSIIKTIQTRAYDRHEEIACRKYLPQDTEYQKGLRFHLESKRSQCDFGVLMGDEGKETLPAGSLYHVVNADGTPHKTEQSFIRILSNRFLN